MEPQALRQVLQAHLTKMKNTGKNIKTLFDLDPSSIICLYRIDLKDKGGYLFHAGENGFHQKIVFNSQSYDFFPIKAEGFEMHGDGRLPRPKLTFSNHQGVISLRLGFFKDFINYKVTRIKTFVKYLDNINFPDNFNPHAEPDPDASFSEDVYYINQKVREDDNIVEFELVSLLELENANIPARTVYYNTCPWVYRGDIGCGYKGKPIADTKDKRFVPSGYQPHLNSEGRVIEASEVGREVYFSGDFTSREFAPENSIGAYNDWEYSKTYNKGDVVRIVPIDQDSSTNPIDLYVCLNNNVQSNPIYDRKDWVKDECSRTLCGCRLRFSDFATGAGGGVRVGEDASDGDNTWIESRNGLPFGGFPGVEPYESR